jgi:hypothetical protein
MCARLRELVATLANMAQAALFGLAAPGEVADEPP